VLTRSQARTRGLARYFTGKPCARGHIAERMTCSANCVRCKKITQARYQATPKGRVARRAAQARYSRTPLGRERTWRYNQSWKRREARDRYENSPKGIARRLDYAARHLPSTTELLEWSRRMPLQLPKRNERQAWAAYRVWRSGGVKNPERP
jgi:hypothetical protein